MLTQSAKWPASDTSQIKCEPAGGVRSGDAEWCTLCVRYGSSATCHVWRTPTDSCAPSEWCSCLHRSCVSHARGYVVDMQNCRSCDVEYVYQCPRLSVFLSWSLPPPFFFLSFYIVSFPVLLCHRSVWLCAGTVKHFPEVSEQSAFYPGSLTVLTLMTGNTQCWNKGLIMLFVLVRL